MTGWKTKTAGGLMIAYAIIGAVLTLLGSDSGMDLSKALEVGMAGLAILGLGHKLDKINR